MEKHFEVYMSPEERTGKGIAGETRSTVEFLMRRMLHKGDLPVFSEHIAEINSKLSSLTAINFSSAGDLAENHPEGLFSDKQASQSCKLSALRHSVGQSSYRVQSGASPWF